jgi:hypothetical protein
MTEHKATETPEAVNAAGHKAWERVLLGEDSISGTLRLIGYIVGFVVIFGSLFHVLG